ncbi:hypothetical protein GE09DRAFT_539532 [Coniochaeta sp. 2T2.1]|nr:hypothetical protein GE09DRAFT_539532 [Coniochaeta sp. 2T2.1]
MLRVSLEGCTPLNFRDPARAADEGRGGPVPLLSLGLGLSSLSFFLAGECTLSVCISKRLWCLHFDPDLYLSECARLARVLCVCEAMGPWSPMQVASGETRRTRSGRAHERRTDDEYGLRRWGRLIYYPHASGRYRPGTMSLVSSGGIRGYLVSPPCLCEHVSPRSSLKFCLNSHP